MDTQAAVEIAHLRKAYGNVAAVDDVSFSVAQGEIFGILGPNGAGKTTTVECVLGLRSPDAGSIRVLGLDPGQDREDLHMIVGAQFQESAQPAKLRVGEILDLYQSFYRDPADVGELIDALGLAGKKKDYYRSLSGGQRQRLSIALALIGRPKIAVLDEMTAGLDPQARRDTWDLVEGVRDQGDDPPGDALHGGGRAAVRPGGPDRRRACRRARQPGRPGRAGQRRDDHALRPLGPLRRPSAEQASRGARGHPQRLPCHRHRDRRAGQRGDPQPGRGGRDRPRRAA